MTIDYSVKQYINESLPTQLEKSEYRSLESCHLVKFTVRFKAPRFLPPVCIMVVYNVRIFMTFKLQVATVKRRSHCLAFVRLRPNASVILKRGICCTDVAAKRRKMSKKLHDASSTAADDDGSLLQKPLQLSGEFFAPSYAAVENHCGFLLQPCPKKYTVHLQTSRLLLVQQMLFNVA